jgi:uncharacterized membrane protein/plastocyanin
VGAHLSEWIELVLRWAHVIFGIAWIGNSFYFMWLDATIVAPDPPRPDVKGELWMVHSGGFYRVEKRLIGPGKLPPVLHWFKYEALFTWITGFCLLTVVYYLRSGIYLVDPSVAHVSVGAATALGIGTLVAAWVVYDLLWMSPLAQRPAIAGAISFAAVLAVAFGLSRVLSGRAAFIHVGALFGTLMVANVWMRILPAQRAMIAATDAGRPPDLTLATRAKQRSVHNNYMTLPVLFVMISNHFPSTYSYPARWAVLGGLIVAGAGVRHFVNTRERVTSTPAAVRAAMGILAGAVAILVALFLVTAPPPEDTGTAAPATAAATAAGAPARKTIDAATVGTIHGTVRLATAPPPPKELALPAQCLGTRTGPALSDEVLVKDGMLANAFVWLGAGAEVWTPPAAPVAEVLVDQKGCLYAPHVLGAQVGQPVTFVNSDPFLHNVSVRPTTRPPYNLSMPGVGMRLTRRFETPEVMVHVKCDVHPWMSAWIGVVAHPWFAVSDAAGTFEIPRVPAGTYTLEAWHEVYGRKSVAVTVTARGTAEAALSF